MSATGVVSIVVIWLSVVSCQAGNTNDKPNVLFIVIDDLRAALNCYGGPIFSPNIDQLAAQSAVFTNAMVQQSVCAPSRTSFLTGRRPDTTKLYDFGSYWRTHAGNYTTLPQHFKESGYFAASVGKVFHPGVTCGNNDDYPYSWSIPAHHSSTEQYQADKVCPTIDGSLHNNVMCPVNVSDMPEKTLPDLQSLATATEILKNLSTRSKMAGPDDMKPPFFLAVGYRKPHIPWRYPKQFISLYPLEMVAIAPNPHRPAKQPDVAWEDYYTLRLRDDIHALNLSFPYGTLPLDYHAPMRQNYYAAASYMDYLVGMLLQALEDSGFANNTIISLHGDHGWQLGDHAEWCKYSNYELATRVPLMVHVPGVTDKKWASPSKFALKDPFKMKAASTSANTHMGNSVKTSNFRKEKAPQGLEIDEFVELVDLFPSLSDLAGLSVPPVCPPKPFKVQFCSEGYSFAPLIQKTNGNGVKNFKRWKNATFSQYPRPGVTPTQATDLPSLKDITVMGYSMRTAEHHYTEWIGFNSTTFVADWTDVKARELYITASDPLQDNNVADEAEYKTIVMMLSGQLQSGWRDCLPVEN